MITFLFWNLKKKYLIHNIKNLSLQHEIDVFMFAEFSIEPDMMLNILNNKKSCEFYYAPGLCSKIKIFTKFSSDFITSVYDSDRITIRHLKLPNMKDILLAVSHFPSKMNWSDSSQASECMEMSKEIRDIEQQIGHSRTVFVGDFNMNPFEDGVVSANGFNAVMTRRIAERKSRIVQNREYPFFYNPMWSIFGDGSPGPPGTYYYNSSQHKNFFWNMFDQVLIRPDLLSCFRNEELKIIDSDGNISFMTSHGIPDDCVASDHLPILFKLRLIKEI